MNVSPFAFFKPSFHYLQAWQASIPSVASTSLGIAAQLCVVNYSLSAANRGDLGCLAVSG